MKLKSQRRVALTLAALIGQGASFTANAMPSFNHNNLLSTWSKELADNPELAGSAFFIDHQDPKVLYVSPSTRKSQTGVFQAFGGAPNCEVLKNQFVMAYNTPDGDFNEAANRGPFSPFFDLQYGNYIRNATIVRSLTAAVEQNEAFRKQHEAIISKFETSQLSYNNSLAIVTKLENSIAALVKAVDNARSAVRDAETDQEKLAAKDGLAAAKARQAAESPELKADLKAANKALEKIRLVYEEAYGQYITIVPDLTANKTNIKELASIFESLNLMADASYKRAEATLKQMEEKVVGLSSASYTVWGKEVSEAQRILGSAVNVRPLPIHNISMGTQYTNFGVPVTTTANSAAIAQAVGGTNFLYKSWNAAVDAVPIDKEMVSTNGVFKKGLALIKPTIRLYDQAGAATFNALVNQAAFCTGTSNRDTPEKTFKKTARDPDNSYSKKIVGYQYAPKTLNLLAQSVALNYEYFVQADPVSVSCSLDIEKTQSFVRDSGSSGFLFWRKSWDNTERTSVKNNSLVCEVESAPSGNDPDPSADSRRTEELKQTMIQEITSEFLQSYAKSWDVVRADPEHTVADGVNITRGMNPAVVSVCGFSAGCSIANIVFKTADELFGSRGGDTSSKDSMKGTISRNYSERTYRAVNGTTAIDLVVPAP